MRLYVTRHGESETNSKNLCCGRWDVDLTKMGEEQAEELALKLEGCTIHAAVSSPLIRARKTAEIIARPHGIEIITDERLVEQDYGIYEGGLRTAPEFAAAKNQFAKRLQNGESNLQVAQRVFNAMDDISKRYPNQSVLVVGHAAICKMIAAYFCDLTDEEFRTFRSGNCELNVYETTEDRLHWDAQHTRARGQ